MLSSAVVYVVDAELLHQDKFAAVGSNVTIQCHGSVVKPVVWQYKNPVELNARHVYDEHGLVSVYVNKYSVNESTYDLTIHKVEVADAGEYWCTEDEGFGDRHVTKLFVTGTVLLLLYSCET